MKTTTLMLIFSSILFATEQYETVEEPTAVSKVMQRFLKTEAIPDTTLSSQDKVKEQTDGSNIESSKTAKFESNDLAYPESGIVDNKTVEKDEPNEEKEEAPSKDTNLAEVEAHARKVIEEEMQKVEEAKKSALEKINEAMKEVEEAKKSENEF